jgi:hypothetical protein
VRIGTATLSATRSGLPVCRLHRDNKMANADIGARYDRISNYFGNRFERVLIMHFLKLFERSNFFALLLLLLSPASQALVCNGGGCQCSTTFGIGFVQGTDGAGEVPNFELAVPHTGGGFSAYYRNNLIQDPAHVTSHSWFGPKTVASGDINGIAMLENAVTNPSGPIAPVPGNGNLEVVTIQDGSLYHYWRDRETKEWSPGAWIAWGFTGQPGFTQSKKWHENFEVVVPLTNGGLAHYWRDNSITSMPWHGPNVFAQGFNFQAVSLIESNFGDGNLEVVARSGSTLYHMYREGDTNWSSPREIRVDGDNPIAATGVHSFVQGTSGNKGDFELIVPLSTGGLMHYSRNNDTTVGGFYPWSTVGWVDQINDYSAAGVIASGFNNLEVIGRRSGNGALATFFSNSSYDSWNRKAGNSGDPIWAGAVFGGEPCCNPVTKGRWQDPYNSGAIGIHSALLPNSKVLFFGFADNNDMGYSEIFDPTNGSGAQPVANNIMPHAFCSGHTLMSDGKLWVAGGHDAPGHESHVDDSHLFNYATSEWTKPDPIQLQTGRWYPTLTRLENGDALVLSGAKEVGRTPVSDEVNLFWQLLDGTGTSLSPEDTSKMVPDPFDPDEYDPNDANRKNFLQLYPFVFQLPDGQVFVHSYRTSRFFSPLTSNTWSATKYVTQYDYSRTYPGYGSAVLMPLSPDDGYRARIMLFGGGGNVSNAEQSQAADSYVPATNSVEQLDLGASSPQWTYKSPMNHPRVLNNAVLLPDGKVFVVGGSTHGSSDHAAAPVQTPEIYNPANDSWTEMCPMRVARLYHSTALLLPDARVLTAGRDHAWNELPYKWPERRVEIFSPPYLESGNPRPVIQTVNNTTPSYGQAFSVTLNSAVPASGISSVVLMAPGAVTHGFDQGQRAIKLSINGRFGNTLTLSAPPNGRVAPPGYYMLFVVSNQGVPSVAKFINVH